jgi:hypothetical protein
MMFAKNNIVVIFLVNIIAAQVFAWGNLGHYSSASIAWQLLDTTTKSKVNRLLKNQDFVKVSTWADAARATPEWKFSMWYHFEKIHDKTSYLESLSQQDPDSQKLGGLIQALIVSEQTMYNKNVNLKDKEVALKFLIHLVSDLHQPLHSGRVDDNGGNKVPIKWNGLDLNLHQIWDTQVIVDGHKDFLNGLDANKSAKKYASYLIKKYQKTNLAAKTNGRYDDWLLEAMPARLLAYTYKDLTEEKYTNKFINIIDERVYLAGLRTAYLVKKVMSTFEPESVIVQLKNGIIDIVGQFFDFVILKPQLAEDLKTLNTRNKYTHELDQDHVWE